MKATFIAKAAVIAALYTILTFIANAMGMSNGVIQLRFSESLCILPLFTSAAIPGLFAGCILSNILTGCALWDIVFGSIATLIGALGARIFTKRLRCLAPLPTVISNTLIIPFILSYVYGISGSIFYFMLTVGIGEIISCMLLGNLLLLFFDKRNIKKL